jgi:hypothetical protein
MTQRRPQEMRWYFRACRDGGVDLDERYYRAQTAFAGPRFRALDRHWLMDGQRVLDAVMPRCWSMSSPVVWGCSIARCCRIRTCISSPWSARHDEAAG